MLYFLKKRACFFSRVWHLFFRFQIFPSVDHLFVVIEIRMVYVDVDLLEIDLQFDVVQTWLAKFVHFFQHDF